MRPTLNFWAIISERMLVTKTTLHITKTTPYPQQSIMVAALYFGVAFLQLVLGYWSRWRELWTLPDLIQFWHTTFRALLGKILKMQRDSIFQYNIMTQNIPPNQQKNGITRRRSKFWNDPAFLMLSVLIHTDIIQVKVSNSKCISIL